MPFNFACHARSMIIDDRIQHKIELIVQEIKINKCGLYTIAGRRFRTKLCKPKQ